MDSTPYFSPDHARKRSRVACTSCQSRKRKCSGDQPCTTCYQFGAECHYDLQSRKKRDSRPLRPLPGPPLPRATSSNVDDPASKATNSHHDQPPPGDSNAIRLSSREANSGAAFVRRLALKIDPLNAPKLHLFAWNVGIRHSATTTGSFTRPVPIVELIGEEEMRSLVSVFFEKVDPCYGFLDRDTLLQQVSRRWSPPTLDTALPFGLYDSVLCGVAAFGYLFSQRQAPLAELQVAETARLILEQSMLSEPAPSPSSVDLITGWVLRVAYLRMTATPHAAWITSCTLMHLIEATGLHLEPPSLPSAPAPAPTGTITQPESSSPEQPCPCDPELRRRLFGMARHLNVWISFELSRSRVVLDGATSLPPTITPDHQSQTELFSLLPVSESLDPSKTQSAPDLETLLSNVLSESPSKPPLILVQCNLMLCIYRRLRACTTNSPLISGPLLDRILSLASTALRAARELVAQSSPWHQIANVPFQVVCTLIAIDTRASLNLLAEAMLTLRDVAASYDTEVMREAYSTAYLLILLHQRRKEEDTRALQNVLRVNSEAPASSTALRAQNAPETGDDKPKKETQTQTQTEAQGEGGDDGTGNGAGVKESTHSLADYPGFSWLSDLLVDMPHLQHYDLEGFIGADVENGGVDKGGLP